MRKLAIWKFRRVYEHEATMVETNVACVYSPPPCKSSLPFHGRRTDLRELLPVRFDDDRFTFWRFSVHRWRRRRRQRRRRRMLRRMLLAVSAVGQSNVPFDAAVRRHRMAVVCTGVYDTGLTMSGTKTRDESFSKDIRYIRPVRR